MRRVLLVIVVLLSAVVPAGAEDESIPNLVNERVWFACGAEKVENAEDNVATWDTEAPTASVTSGAGCGTIDLPFMQTAPGNIYDATWTGYFTGNLDTLTVELHNIYVGPGRATGKIGTAVQLLVDGTPMFDELGHQVELNAVRSATGASEQVTFSISNIGYVSEAEDFEHEVTLLMHGGTALNRGPTVTDTLSGWVWDTTEVPSGITFNPPALAEQVLPVTPR
jgi:hypothetical protein